MRELHQPYSEIQTMSMEDLSFFMSTLADSAKETNKEMEDSMSKMKSFHR